MTPADAQAMTLILSFWGLVAASVLLLYSIDRDRAAKKAPPPPASIEVRSAWDWQLCPAGHMQILTNREFPCPVCGAQTIAVPGEPVGGLDEMREAVDRLKDKEAV